MPFSPVVVVGGSAGAMEPLRELVRTLPLDFPAAVLVVLHLSPDHPSRLPEILRAGSALPVEHLRHQSPLLPGHIYVAPPDHHLLVGQDQVLLSRGPRENRSRPSIDVLFRSAAYTHGAQVIGVLLSGMLDDGTSGLWTIKRLGGHAVIQHPEEALYPSMPMSALQQVTVDAIVPAHDIAARLQAILVAPNFGKEPSEMKDEEWQRLALEVRVAQQDNAFEAGILNQGPLSAFTCPECHGVLVKLQEGGTLRFRCHTGHAYTSEALLSDLHHSTEMSIWNTLRALEEEIMLLEHLTKHAEEAEQPLQAQLYRNAMQVATAQLRVIRTAVLDPPLPQEGGVSALRKI